MVRGDLPSSEADQLLQIIVLDAAGQEEPMTHTRDSITSSSSSSHSSAGQNSADEAFDLELAKAISASLEGATK